MHSTTFFRRLCRAATVRQTLARLLLALGVFSMPMVTHAADAARDYLIGPGDSLRITVYQSPDLTLETRVAESGTITYPLLGSVKLGGLSVAQAEAEITRGLREGSFSARSSTSATTTLRPR